MFKVLKNAIAISVFYLANKEVFLSTTPYGVPVGPDTAGNNLE